MEGNEKYRDFEHFIKTNADDYRMFPSEKSWNRIHNAIHTRRKWEGYGLLGLLLLVTMAVTWVMITYPVDTNTTQTTNTLQSIPNTESQISSEITAQELSATLQPFAENEITNPVPQNLVERFVNNASPSAQLNHIQTNAYRIATLESIALADVGSEKITETISSENWNSPLFNISQVTDLTTPNDLNKISLINKNHTPDPEEPAEVIPTIESVLSSIKDKQQKKWGWQIFVTPTVSYRGLSDNTKPHSRGTFRAFRDLDNIVLHKPDMGLQLGLLANYPLTKWLKFRGGLQFNINKYDIRAFDYRLELARIDLNPTYGRNNVVTTWTSHRNIGGFQEGWLKNTYYSVSAPIGFELKIVGNEKTNWSIGTTIQPSYIIKDKAYILSTDYKNYAEVPSLTRRFNLNTGVEAVVNFKTKRDVQWQIGPQVRYQLMSSFDDSYPVRENLFDAGIKIGVNLNK